MKNILFLVSEWGYWGEELIGPLEACDQAGYKVDFLSPTGQKPTALTVSMDPKYIDPPLGRGVTTAEMAEKVRLFTQSGRDDSPRSLKQWFPQRAYPSSPTYLRDMEAYHKKIDSIVANELTQYDALVIVGGSGALVDLANNSRVHDLVLGFAKLNKPIAAECYGVTCLAFARDIREKRSLIAGRRVTGHPLDYDYLDGTGFEGPHAVDGTKKGFGDGWVNFGGRRSIRSNTFSAMPSARKASSSATSATRLRSSSTIRSSPAARPPRHVNAARCWWMSSKRASSGTAGSR